MIGERDLVVTRGKDLVRSGVSWSNSKLLSGDLPVEQCIVADPALFYVEFWADRIGLELPEACQAHYSRMLSRSPVRQVLMEEGYGAVIR